MHSTRTQGSAHLGAKASKFVSRYSICLLAYLLTYRQTLATYPPLLAHLLAKAHTVEAVSIVGAVINDVPRAGRVFSAAFFRVRVRVR